jgi:hypothetical protein
LGREADHDGWVKVDSVRNIYRKSCLLGIFCTSKQLVIGPFPRDPGDDLFYKHTQLGSAESHFSILLNGILSDSTALPSMLALRASDLPGFPMSLRRISSLEIGPGATSEVELPVVVGPADDLVLRFSGQVGDLDVLDPYGRRTVLSAESVGEPGVSADEWLGSFIAIENPTPGVWRFIVPPPLGDTALHVSAFERSPAAFEAYVNPGVLEPGKTATLIAYWRGADAGTPAASVEIRTPDGDLLTTVPLSIDPTPFDTAVVLTGTMPLLPQSGRYELKFAGEARLHGHLIRREETTFADVTSSAGLLSGVFDDASVDQDGDSIADLLRVSAGLNLLEAGGYLVSGELYDANDYPLGQAAGFVRSETPGDFVLNLDFPAPSLCEAYPGPFSVRNITVQDASTLAILERWEGTVTTSLYDGTLAGCTSGQALPEIASVEPAGLFPGETGRLFISGSGFQCEAGVNLGDGITIHATTCGPEVLILDVEVSAGAVAGGRTVSVTNSDNRSSSRVEVFAVLSDQPPIVTFTSPSASTTVTASTWISADARDDRGIARVEFFVDSTLVGTVHTFPYRTWWNIGPGLNGTRSIRAVAYDTAGNTTEVEMAAGVAAQFPAGDANGDSQVSVSDIFYLISHLFAGGPPSTGAADTNGDGNVNVSDIFYLINYLFAGGPPPV